MGGGSILGNVTRDFDSHAACKGKTALALTVKPLQPNGWPSVITQIYVVE